MIHERRPTIIKPPPKLSVVRMYHGMTREFVVNRWVEALQSGRYARGNCDWLFDPTMTTCNSGYKHQGLFCPYGVLCHSLELPALAMTLASGGSVIGYADIGSTDYQYKTLPDELHRLLIPYGGSKLTPDFEALDKASDHLVRRIERETELTLAQLNRIQPTIWSLAKHGLSFQACSLLIESNLFKKTKDHVSGNIIRIS